MPVVFFWGFLDFPCPSGTSYEKSPLFWGPGPFPYATLRVSALEKPRSSQLDLLTRSSGWQNGSPGNPRPSGHVRTSSLGRIRSRSTGAGGRGDRVLSTPKATAPPRSARCPHKSTFPSRGRDRPARHAARVAWQLRCEKQGEISVPLFGGLDWWLEKPLPKVQTAKPNHQLGGS